MGWTSYIARHYTSKGLIDRKAEIDDYFHHSRNEGATSVIKSTLVGSVYYGAVRQNKKYNKNTSTWDPIPKEQQEVFGVVFLTSVQGLEFSYKDMDETEGPCYYDCPQSILKLLSPTNNKYALEWRAKCRENVEKAQMLKKARDTRALVKMTFNSDIEWDNFVVKKGCPCMVSWYPRRKIWLLHDSLYGIKPSTVKCNLSSFEIINEEEQK